MADATLLPALAATKLAKPVKEVESDQSKTVKRLCKTLGATVQNLLYSFTALQLESAESGGAATLSMALAASKREELSGMIVDTLSGTVEKVIKNKDTTIRSSVLRDLRARFTPPEKPKPELVDQGVQAMQWAAKAAARTEQLRAEKENREREAEKVEGRKVSGKWGHVESVMRKQRLASEETWKAEMKEQFEEEREARRDAERRVREEAVEKAKLASARDAAEAGKLEAMRKLDVAHERAMAAESKYEGARKAQEELARMHAEELEIRDAFGDKGLEAWPMFPGRKLFRVLEQDEFDGRVSQEFRVKDAESGERGVTLLMGRLANSNGAVEAQAVLFESKYLSDLEAARWWANHKGRFERVRERLALQAQRARSAGGSRRQRPELM